MKDAFDSFANNLKRDYRNSRNSFPSSIVSTATIQFMNLRIAIMRKLYENFHIFHIQKKIFRGNYRRIYVFKKTEILEKCMRRDNLFNKINCLHFVIFPYCMIFNNQVRSFVNLSLYAIQDQMRPRQSWYLSPLGFWNIEFEKSSLMNWNICLVWARFLLPV